MDAPDRKITFTAKALSADETISSDGSMLISVHRPPNLSSEQEAREFSELFGPSIGLLEEPVITQARVDLVLAGNWRGDSFFTEITYETVEVDSSIKPLTFSSIRRV